MAKDNTTLLVLGAAAVGLYLFTQKKGGAEDKTISEAEAALRIKQEETKQKQLELDYMEKAADRDWEDVAMDFFGGVAQEGGKAVGGWLGQISF